MKEREDDREKGWERKYAGMKRTHEKITHGKYVDGNMRGKRT